ncbi:MAG TPA: phosphatase PAP2 family protein [Lachnospiraceae bacterium]|jgi:undecaprenyl-diphosphatase|nr:phosphatase PAP2 family protein [Lachnospiraceae bacterium]HCR39642.1 phosphatase PAP2 family protein [Lachnospiraceae bacterium]
MLDNLQLIDERILFFIQNNWKTPALDHVMVFLTSLGNAGVLWICIAAILIFSKHRQKSGVILLSAIFAAMFLGDDILKPLIGRIRPCDKFPEVELLLGSIGSIHSPSFPSGHAMVGFASATVLFYYDRRFGIIAYLTASLIAFSRLYLFVHYPSDLLGGLILGVFTALLTIFLLNLVYHRIELLYRKFLP